MLKLLVDVVFVVVVVDDVVFVIAVVDDVVLTP